MQYDSCFWLASKWQDSGEFYNATILSNLFVDHERLWGNHAYVAWLSPEGRMMSLNKCNQNQNAFKQRNALLCCASYTSNHDAVVLLGIASYLANILIHFSDDESRHYVQRLTWDSLRFPNSLNCYIISIIRWIIQCILVSFSIVFLFKLICKLAIENSILGIVVGEYHNLNGVAALSTTWWCPTIHFYRIKITTHSGDLPKG